MAEEEAIASYNRLRTWGRKEGGLKPPLHGPAEVQGKARG